MANCVYDPSIDMSGYIPLNKRVHSACHCVECCKDAWIRSCYKRDDFLVQFGFDRRVAIEVKRVRRLRVPKSAIDGRQLKVDRF